MTLRELIDFLTDKDADIVAKIGFANPHSYRGYYDELAFEPAENVTVGKMLESAKKALGTTYCGWKGGDFKMEEYTDVWLAVEGRCGEGIGPTLLLYMVGEL